ncbi:MAG: hypothetical protein IJH99_08890 [Eubacterium sp.]|nr:hypothetical protein [Eubacterium sp.]
MLNQKQNLLRMLNGDMPEYVPVSRFGPGITPMTVGGLENPSILGDFRGPKGGYDPWGVHYVANKETNYAPIPEPGNFILEDVTKWEEVMKVPEHWKDWDWEKAAEKDIAKLNWDPEQSLYVGKGFDDFFQQFIGLMGFTNGLCALYEEPEAVHALLDWMCDQVIDITKNVLYYYKPEAYYMVDDSASKLTPFVGPEMFDEFFVPRYKRTLDLVRDAGLPVFYHNCGRCEDLLPSMVRLGVRCWDPAQKENNLVEVKKRFGRQLIIRGGFEYPLPITWPEIDEEEVRQAVRDKFDELAPNGAFIFSGGVTSMDYMDPRVQEVNGWITDEALKLSTQYY